MVPFARQVGLSVAVLATSVGAAFAAVAAPAHGSGSEVAPRQVVALEAPPAKPVVVPSPAAKPKPKPSPAAKPKAITAPKPKPTVRHTSTAPVVKAPAPAPVVTRTTSSGSLTQKEIMMRAVARIPGYRSGEAVWIVKSGLGSWGLSAMGGGTVWISTTVPSNRMYDVVSHEWSHILSVKNYDNHTSVALDAMNAYFGGSGLTGAERAADCMAILLGATWTNYTSCTNTHWRDGARRLLNRQRL